MLTPQERDKLYAIIVSVIGEDVGIKSKKAFFNNQTVEVVKEMVKANKDCNEAMKALAVNLMEVTRLSPGRWVKRAFAILRGYAKDSEFKGAACKNVTKYHWKRAINLSTI